MRHTAEATAPPVDEVVNWGNGNILQPNADTDVKNSDVNWDAFDPVSYRDHNYLTLRDDDRQIMVIIRDFFAAADVCAGRGLDVGAGPNLYPSLAMLPFCRRLDLLEFSAPNVAWLQRQVRRYDASWDDFWAVYRESPAYARIDDPRAVFAEIASVQKANIFELPRREWDLGTMFFVACSLSTEPEEFRQAVACFVQALKPNAPFAAAFMEESEGYAVHDTWFPAVGVHEKEVTETLAEVAYDIKVESIEITGPKLREGYSGMIVACGRAAG
jgi:hypothetical protein